MLVGLQYTGTANGLTIMLYKSYKTVTVAWDKAYRFTNKDNTSDDAKRYYLKNYLPLGIKLIEEPDLVEIVKEETIEEVAPTINTSESDNIVETTPEVKESVEVISEEVTSEVSEDVIQEESSDILSSVIKSIIEEYGRESIENASESDLGEIIDSRFDESQVKTLCSRVGYDYGRTRNKSKIINGLVSNNSADIVSYFLG